MCSDRNQQDSPSKSYWQVEIDAEKCSLCEVCARHCPPEAIQSEQAEDTLFILFWPELCDGCRICLERCPEDAMRLLEVEVEPTTSERKTLVESKMLRCSVCGTYFAPVSKLEAASRKREDHAQLVSEQCPLCRRTQMVATFIEEKREARGRKAEYRTGKKWQWKPVTDGDPNGPPCPEVLDMPSSRETPVPGEDAANGS